jgi:hypothetical protein
VLVLNPHPLPTSQSPVAPPSYAAFNPSNRLDKTRRRQKKEQDAKKAEKKEGDARKAEMEKRKKK